MTTESSLPTSTPTLVVEDDAQLRKRLESAFTSDTPETARKRIVDAIIRALNDVGDD